MIKIEVGKNFPLIKARDGVMFDLKEEGFFVFLGMKDITDDEIEEFKKGKLMLDLSFINDIIFFVLEIGDFLLSDAPFHVGLIRPVKKREEIIDREGIYSMQLFLIDTKNNILKGIRVIGLTEAFSETIEHFLKPLN